jgi:hypothetical protein
LPILSVIDQSGAPNDGKIDFGEVATNAESTSKITLKNIGSGDLVIGALGATNKLEAPFEINKDTCSNVTLAPDVTCDFTVKLVSDRSGPINEAFDVSSNDANTPTIINLNATVFVPVVNRSPTAPVLLAPEDGDSIRGNLEAMFRWSPSSDPDGDAIAYSVVYCSNSSFIGCSEKMVEGKAALPWTETSPPESMQLFWYVVLALTALLIKVQGARPARFSGAILSLSFLIGSCNSGLQVSHSVNAEKKPTESTAVVEGGIELGVTDATEMAIPPPIAPGLYYWKVVALDARGAKTESSIRSVTVK